MGLLGNSNGFVQSFRNVFSRVTFKLDYLSNDGLPHWAANLAPAIDRLGSKLGILSLHKYLRYRQWFRRELATYLKGEMFDAAYLQQNAFDEVDASTHMSRQVRDLKLLHKAIGTQFRFRTKQEARKLFASLQDAFYQKNYCAEDSSDYAEYERRINGMMAMARRT